MKTASLKEIARLLKLPDNSSPLVHAYAHGVAVDTRHLQKGDLFFALPGAHTDGHAFLSHAAARGAVGAVVDHGYSGPDFGLPLLRCSNTLEALRSLAKAHLKNSSAHIIAVTGSVGKTTTKEFIRILLSEKFRVAASSGNQNSEIGLPMTLLNQVDLTEEAIVLEMGMTGAGHIAHLLEIAAPAVAVVTKVALVHAGYFESIEEITRAKGEIFSHPATRLGIYALESDFGNELSQAGNCEKLTFSTENRQADLFLQTMDHALLIHEGPNCAALPCLSLPGRHNQHNFLAAVAVALSFGLTWEEIQAGQKKLALPERRLQTVEKWGVTFVNDSYNACEISVKAALDALPLPKPGGKRIAVLSYMVELGKFSRSCHLAIGEYALEKVDAMFCFGEECKPILECWQAAGRPVVWAQDRQGLIDALQAEIHPGDVVLLKGSRLNAVWKVLDELRHPLRM